MPLAAGRRCNVRAALRAKGAGRGTERSESLPLVRQRPDGDRRDASAASDPSRARGVGADPRAGRIRYVLIPFDSKETNRLITGVETTFEEVTVDSLSFKSKNALGTRWAMLRQRCRCWASVNIRRARDDPAPPYRRSNHPFREPRPRLNPHRRRPAPRGSVQKIVSEVPTTARRECDALPSALQIQSSALCNANPGHGTSGKETAPR